MGFAADDFGPLRNLIQIPLATRVKQRSFAAETEPGTATLQVNK